MNELQRISAAIDEAIAANDAPRLKTLRTELEAIAADGMPDVMELFDSAVPPALMAEVDRISSR